MEATPGEEVDYNFIMSQIAQLLADYDIQEMAFDRGGVAKLRTGIETSALPWCTLDRALAAYRHPCLVIDKQIHHVDHPVLA